MFLWLFFCSWRTIYVIRLEVRTVDPAITVAVLVVAPEAPPALQRMSGEVTSVMGEL